MHRTRQILRLALPILAFVLVSCTTNSPSNPGNNFQVEIVNPPADLCVQPGTSITFLAEQTGTAGNPEVRWSVDNANATVPSTAAWTFLVTLTELGSYTFTATGHDDGSREPTDTRTITVAEYCAMFVTIDTPEEGAIYGPEEPITFSATVTGATDPLEHDWDFSENSGIPDSQEQYPTGSIPEPGDYSATLTVTDGTGATASATVNFEVAEVTEIDSPVSSVNTLAPTPPNFAGSNTPDGGMMLFGNDGAALLDLATLTFGDVLLPGTNFFGGAVAMPVSGPQAVIGYDFTESKVSYYDEGSSAFLPFATLHPGIGQDLSSFEGIANFGGFVFCDGSNVRVQDTETGEEDFAVHLEVGAAQFPGMSGTIASAAARNLDDGFLAVIDASPGELWHHDGGLRADAVLVGTLGSRPEKIRCAGEIAVVIDRTDDTCTVVTWSEAGAVSIAGSFATGESPRGCDLMLLPGGNYACVVACRHDNTVTVAEIAPNGSVVSSEILDTPIDCGSPQDAAWLRDGSTNLLVTCLSGDNVFVLPSGL